MYIDMRHKDQSDDLVTCSFSLQSCSATHSQRSSSRLYPVVICKFKSNVINAALTKWICSRTYPVRAFAVAPNVSKLQHI